MKPYELRRVTTTRTSVAVKLKVEVIVDALRAVIPELADVELNRVTIEHDVESLVVPLEDPVYVCWSTEQREESGDE